jgi:hypothetical protein
VQATACRPAGPGSPDSAFDLTCGDLGRWHASVTKSLRFLSNALSALRETVGFQLTGRTRAQDGSWRFDHWSSEAGPCEMPEGADAERRAALRHLEAGLLGERFPQSTRLVAAPVGSVKL